MQQRDTLLNQAQATSNQSRHQRLLAIITRPAVALPLLTLLALALRFYKLGYYSYFDDEVLSTFAARQPAWEIFHHITANEDHPPLYHILLHLWMLGFGDSLIAVRLFSVLISTACVPLLYALGRSMANRPAALAAAGLMAIAPFQIYHGRQARMYPLLTLLVMLATLLFVHVWQRGGWWRWWLFGLTITAGIYTHAYFWLSLLALNVWALADTIAHRRIERKRWAGLIVAQALAGLAFAPFLPQFFGTVNGVVQSFWLKYSSPYDWIIDLIALTNYAPLVAFPGPAAPWYLLPLYFPPLAILILGLGYSVREARRHPHERDTWLLLHMLIWVPIVIATTISVAIRPILLDRSLIGLSSALFLILGWMFVRYWQRFLIQLLALAFVATCVVSIASMYPPVPQQNDLVRMADYLAREARPGDAIAYADWQSFDTAALMYPHQPDVYIVPLSETNKSYWEARMRFMRWREPHQVETVPTFGPHYRRVWLVFSLYTVGLDQHKQVDQAWLEQHGRRIDRVEFNRAVVLLYEVLR
jgi:mannosyltransferase